jgi:lipopolysaccharide biosynthesis regulator YciM
MSEHLAAARELVRAAIDQIDARLAELHAESVDLSENRARLVVVLEGPSPIAADRTLDTVTPEEWRAASPSQRQAFIAAQASHGLASFRCTGCGFPTARGVASCEACRPMEVRDALVTETPAARPVSPPARTLSGRARTPEATGVFRVDAANRILAWLEKHGTATAPELVAASKVSKPTMTRVVTDLLQAKRLVRTGLRRATRYTLPSCGRAQPAAAPTDSEGDRGAKRGGRR